MNLQVDIFQKKGMARSSQGFCLQQSSWKAWGDITGVAGFQHLGLGFRV